MGMMMLGPVSNAANSEPTIAGALFFIGVGSLGLLYGWFRFFRTAEGTTKPELENLLGLTLICCTMIGLGIWKWVKAVRIPN